MKSPAPSQGLAAGAAAVTVLLTAAAFWLSYEHLHDVAGGNGLTGVRAWVWPATVDLFIVAGELLILRASLQNRVDGWAIALAATGSLGSIALNVAGVGDGASRMEYVVAAVPPSAALIAFGALMRQVHDAIARAQKPAAVTTPEPPVAEVDDHPVEPPAPQRYGDPVVIRPAPEVVPAGVELLPIVAPQVTTEVTIERVTEGPEGVVTRPAIETEWKMLDWSSIGTAGDHQRPAELTTALAAAEPRQVVTVPVTITPAELRKQARKLNRQLVTDTGRQVTIERLREEYGLSRREATELRREVVGSSRS
ncbi:DUF2637 domain-containing protein [Streptomyces halstedii]|uniref:DUF2637 domain-containing protein n=1 Tax=Streptomyces halstedii TaxID=1944 RepID=UPI00381B922D